MNQVVEILVKFLETRDWKTSFFTVIPQRKRTGVDPISCSEEHQEKEGDEDEKHDLLERKKLCVEVPLESGS